MDSFPGGARNWQIVSQNRKGGKKGDQRFVARSGGEHIELLGKGWLRIAGKLRLLLAHHVDPRDPTHCDTSAPVGLEVKRRSDPPLDGTGRGLELLRQLTEMALEQRHKDGSLMSRSPYTAKVNATKPDHFRSAIHNWLRR